MIVRKITILLCISGFSIIPGISEHLEFDTIALRKSPLSALMRLSQNESAYQISSKLKVVGGTEARPHQFPFQVSIQVRNYEGTYDHNCGGVIYDATHIITAAHCLRGYHHRNLKVIAGEHDLTNPEDSEQFRDVLGYAFHPNFEPIILDNDIGIITLDFPLDLNEKVQPLKLPSGVMEHPKTALTIGWGSDGYTENTQSKLLFVQLNIYPRDQCLRAYESRATITEGMFCAGDKEGKGSCKGDSGGSLVCKEPGESGKDYLCGLVSWGMVPCTLPEFPTVFTDINVYLDWLQALLPPQEE